MKCSDHDGVHFRKKPVVIEAVKVNLHRGRIVLPSNLKQRWPVWLLEAIDGDTIYVKDERLMIKTLESVSEGLEVSDGGWIIRGVKGELYPCKPDIFEATYEPAIDPPIEDDEDE